ncbi:MAG: Gfo/Idh/MocA family oxidoreductase [Verrucomicrobiales bacterium]|jgi:predicted dehydrogenase|nr:Gfo/Idh/MocA family oxidoreductase [Verrucomicrobiales bacterium]
MQKYKKANDIKVGVVGYGGAFNMGKQHLQQMLAAGMTPLAVTEVDAGRLVAARADFPGIETYPTVGAMLKKSRVDLVVIITPHNTHAQLTLQCLRAGRHVVCEKPLAITTAEVDAMIAAAKKSGVILSTYHNRHWDGCILEAVERIKKQKVIGDIIRIECHMGGYNLPRDWWRSSRTVSGGILYDWGVHLLEYSLQLIDAELTEVSGFSHHGFWAPLTKWKKDTIEDEGFAVVRFKGGQWLTLAISSIDSKPKDGRLEITGTKGTYVLDGNDHTIYRHADGEAVTVKKNNRADATHKYYENVRDHLVKGKPLTITGEWSRRPIHILDLAVRSAKAGKALTVKYV